MADTDNTSSADERQPLRHRHSDGSYPDFEDDREDLDYLFESLRRLTL
jgi:hypothetical protein